MDDSFELEYADELEALEDNEIDIPSSDASKPKSKRSLQFDDSLKPSDFDELTLEREGLSQGADHLNRLLHSPPDDFLQSAPRKKAKLDENDDSAVTAALISQIQQQRQQSGNAHSHTKENPVHHYRLNDDDDVVRPRVSKRIPQCDFISAHGFDGECVYMKLWDEDVLEAEYSSLGQDARSSSLLPVPVCILRDQLDEETSNVDAHLAGMEETHVSAKDLLDQTNEAMNTVNNNLNSLNNAVDDMSENETSLWVEKYAPNKYTELLSEESVNRSLLHWLKLWDYVVFDKEIPKARKDKKLKEKEFKNKKFQPDIADALDKYKRPGQKIALLCGPPGLGKTTLAHIVARHAGYNVVEMNASDDRSVDTFRNKLESATQMKAVLGADPCPNCLVIDEIDGAPGPAINVLLNAIKSGTVTGNQANKKKKENLLLRPIICICNDQYVPALRQLRQMALVINFPQTEASRLASRLYEVAQVENLKADINSLLALCEKTENDIRSCLNTLQFIHENKKELTLHGVRIMSVGQKDFRKSLFSVWHDVFSMPRPKKNRFVSIHELTEGNQTSTQSNNITLQARFQHILHMCQSAGEYDRVMQGLFENYLEAKSKDPHLLGLNLVNDWMCFIDCNNQYIARFQDYSVAKYAAYLPIVFHFLYASYTPQRLQFPLSQTDAHQRISKTSNLILSMLADMLPSVRKFINPVAMTLDVLPPLLDILQPTLRPVNTLLYSAREKEELANVVRVMIAYNMTYRQEKSPEGQYVYVLDPNVEDVINFPDLKQRKQLTYAAKQMIAREIEVEKMRRNEIIHPKAELLPPPSVTQKTSTRKETSYENDSSELSSSVPNHLQKLKAKEFSSSQKPAINFFGNIVRTKRQKSERPENDKETSPKIDERKKKLLDTIIWFHFKEGFSNAVRRTVKVEDLL